MAGFLYFLPGDADRFSRQRLADAGLLGLVRVEGLTERGVRSGGPDGGSGMVIVPRPELAEGLAATPGYFPAAQIWEQSPDGKYWVGYEREQPPRPLDLGRAEVVDGHAVTLGDGNEWLIPVGRLAMGGTRFEKRLRLGPAGEWVSEVLPAYHELVEQAERIHAFLLAGDGEASMDDAEAIDLAVRLLTLNYRIGRLEASALGLLTTRCVGKVLEAFIDVPSIVQISQAMSDAQKKSALPAEAGT